MEGSIKAVASSMIKTLGFLIATRATDNSCRSPEDKLPPRSLNSVFKPLGNLFNKGDFFNEGDCVALLGAQNININNSGAYTGEISSEMIKDHSVSHVILGHSERRSMCNETSKDVSLKSYKAISKGLNVIICIGESLKERESNSFLSILENQLISSLPKLIGNEFEISDFQITIAYEPIWAIGSGKVATNENIEEVHKFIKNCLRDYFKSSTKIPVIYGGSVNANNSIQILKLNSVDGVLVGGASLKSYDFIEIAKNSL